MPFINQALVDGAAVVARQAASTTAALVSSAVSTTPSAIPSPTSTTSPVPSPTDTGLANGGANGGQGQGNGPSGSQSSPLLFFVALGFGVVFTNLWIIVGVKYCFRYNARSRQMRLTEDGEPITLENMPRPHRRRREKKLMTMEEVNEKFPMLKYKNWVAGRAREGLPTRGGVSAMPSRANSVRSVEGVVPELPSKERESTDDHHPVTSPTLQEKSDLKQLPQESTSGSAADSTVLPAAESQASAAAAPGDSLPEPATARKSDEHDQTDDEDDDEHIDAALPPECVGTAGDTCAICIDTLEDDDDVRGLTCGHAFHAVCLDPWLTSRRACCPLCKADYYTPKPRPAATEADGVPGVVAVAIPGDGRHRMNMPSRPQGTWISIRGSGRIFPARFIISGSDNVDRPTGENPSASRRPGFFSRSGHSRNQATAAGVPATQPASSTPDTGSHWFSNVRSVFPPFRANQTRSSGNSPQNPSQATQEPVVSGANPEVSPSQLEAGVRVETR